MNIIQIALDYHGFLGGTVLILCLTILPVLAIFKRTRLAAVIGYYISSVIFGLGVWLISVSVVYSYWGGWAVIVGVFILGIGVFPMALVIIFWYGLWDFLLPLASWGVLVFACQIVVGWLLSAGQKYS